MLLSENNQHEVHFITLLQDSKHTLSADEALDVLLKSKLHEDVDKMK